MKKLSLLFSIFSLCILINSEALAYCASYSNTYYAAYIGEIGIRNKGSQNGPSYYTFDTSVMQVIKGSCNVSYIGLRSITGQYDSLYTRIWADWNHNNVFEASELVYQSREKTPKTGGNYFYDLVVPSWALLGKTTMRFITSPHNYRNPCDINYSGETEDRIIYVNASDNYCQSKGNSTAYEYINYVSSTPSNITSGNNSGYYQHCNYSFSFIQTYSPTINIGIGYTSKSYVEYARIYMDLNSDGDFADSGELMGSGSGLNMIPITVTIPNYATTRLVRMRVQLKYGSYTASSCETFAYGEVEDYTVLLMKLSGGALEKEETSFSNKLDDRTYEVKKQEIEFSQNGAGEIEWRSLSDFEGKSNFSIFNLNGQCVFSKEFHGVISGDQFSTSLPASGIYIAQFTNNGFKKTKKFSITQ
jgi:hypothetical protein